MSDEFKTFPKGNKFDGNFLSRFIFLVETNYHLSLSHLYLGLHQQWQNHQPV